MRIIDLPHHHALLLVDSERVTTGEKLWKDLKSLSPAHCFFNQTVLSIDIAREIISWAQTPYNDEKIALISFHSASIPAQNAMLKILEEPNEGVKFILLTNSKDNLIDTVLSRIYEIKTNNDLPAQTGERRTKNEEDAIKFLQMPHSSRMKLPFIIEILALVDEKGRKDRENIRSFILSLSDVLSKEKVSAHYTIEVIRVASYSSDASVSGKALLEYLSLLLPQLK